MTTSDKSYLPSIKLTLKTLKKLETSSKLPKRIPTQRYLTLFQCLPSRQVATQSYTHTMKILEESRWIKSGGLEMLCKKVFTGKHMCQSFFFNNVAGLRPATLLKKRLQHRYFPVNLAKFLRTRSPQNTSEQLLLINFKFENVFTCPLINEQPQMFH